MSRIEHELHGQQINAYKIIRNLNCRRPFVPLSTVQLTVVGNSERTGHYSSERTGQYSSERTGQYSSERTVQ